MNILFLGYWNADDPLTAATIVPHLKILKETSSISKLVFTSVQREHYSAEIQHEIQGLGVIFAPIFSRNLPFNLINKIFDFIALPRDILNLIEIHEISLIIARGAPAGALSYLVYKTTKVPFIVESYEPHSSYMIDSGVWSKFDPRYIMQTLWEKRINQYAQNLITVSEGYKRHLVSQGVPTVMIKVSPCAVSPKKFFIDKQKKTDIRASMDIPNTAIVGIYVGKFGGLYYGDRTFLLFKKLAISFGGNIYFIILNNMSNEEFESHCVKHQLDTVKFRRTFVSHNQVNDYLNAADFALAPYRKTQSAQYLSPVKLGEYWAAGLVTLLTDGVGDETEFIEDEHLGVALDMDRLDDSSYFDRKVSLLKVTMGEQRSDYIRNFALKYRSFKKVRDVYEILFSRKNYVKSE